MAAASNRLKAEIRRAVKHGWTDGFAYLPTPDNARKWVVAFDGPPDTPYEGGRYVATIDLPEAYPFKSPTIRVLTPSGRFKTGSTVCIDGVTHFHESSWSPVNTLDTVVRSLISFMANEASEANVGSIVTTDDVKRELAAKSADYCRSHIPSYKLLFNDLLGLEDEEEV